MLTKKRIWEILEKANKGDKSSFIFDILISLLILLNVFSIILESIPEYNMYNRYFQLFEIFSVIIFTIEYLLRVYTCTTSNTYKNRIQYLFSFMALIDLISILPFYLPMITKIDLRILRIFRTLRIARLFKLGRYSKAVNALISVFKSKKEELFTSLIIALFLLLIASSLMYSVESKYQPDAFKSIIHTMWWGVATLTTVGYGDVYPITPAGKFLGAIMAILGIGLFALPAGIIASGYQEYHNKEKKICPHCKKQL